MEKIMAEKGFRINLSNAFELYDFLKEHATGRVYVASGDSLLSPKEQRKCTNRTEVYNAAGDFFYGCSQNFYVHKRKRVSELSGVFSAIRRHGHSTNSEIDDLGHHRVLPLPLEALESIATHMAITNMTVRRNILGKGYEVDEEVARIRTKGAYVTDANYQIDSSRNSVKIHFGVGGSGGTSGSCLLTPRKPLGSRESFATFLHEYAKIIETTINGIYLAQKATPPTSMITFSPDLANKK